MGPAPKPCFPRIALRLLPKHLLLSVLPTLATLALVLFVMRGIVRDLLLARIEAGAADEATYAATSSEQLIERELEHLRVMARMMTDADPEAVRTALWAERAAAPELLALVRIDDARGPIGTDGIDPQVILHAAEGGHTAEVVDRESDRVILLFARGRQATLAGAISTDEVISPIARLRVGHRGFAYLTDRDGRLLTPARPRGSAAELAAGLTRAGEGSAWADLDGEPHLFVGRRIDPLGWHLGITVPRDEAMDDIHSMRQVTAAMVLGAIVVLLISGFVVSRTLTRPIESLRRVQERFGAGELDAREEVAARDELGELARSFNEMADRLNRVIADSRSLVESLPQPVFVHANGRFLYLNPAACRLAADPDPVGRAIDAFAAEGSREETRRLLEGAPSARIQRRDGKSLDLEAVGLEVTFDGARARLVIVDDITDKNRFESQVRQTQKLESLGLVAGGIAHDFNNMLTAIMGNNELVLMDTPESSPLFGPLQHVRRATEKASDLCRQMLAYAGRGHFQLAHIDLNRTVAEIGELLQASISKKTTLSMELDREALPIEADAAQIQQVVMNLITNASEALEDAPGEITVRTGTVEIDDHTTQRTLEGLPKGTYAMLEVIDSGVGMDQKTKDRIFDPFFTTKLTGRGLGLAGVLGIVRAHLGDITVDSEPDVGTRFSVYFPKAEQPVPEERAAPLDELPYYGQGTVLVADDEAPVLQLTRRILARYGFEVACAQNGEQAIDLYTAKKGEIVCALLDLTMPVLGGREVLERLRSIDPGLPVVLMSGYDDGSDDLIATAGSVPFVAKPFRVSVLINAIRDATERSRTGVT